MIPSGCLWIPHDQLCVQLIKGLQAFRLQEGKVPGACDHRRQNAVFHRHSLGHQLFIKHITVVCLLPDVFGLLQPVWKFADSLTTNVPKEKRPKVDIILPSEYRYYASVTPRLWPSYPRGHHSDFHTTCTRGAAAHHLIRDYKFTEVTSLIYFFCNYPVVEG